MACRTMLVKQAIYFEQEGKRKAVKKEGK